MIFLDSILLELTSDRTLKNRFESTELDTFWLGLKDEYGLLSRKAVDKLLQFSTTYLCESAFSTMTVIKTKQRNRLDAEEAMILAISPILPNIKELSKNVVKQTHKYI